MIELAARQIESAGARLNVWDGGDPAGPPMLLLHGLRDVGLNLRPIAEPFADRFQLLLPDLRGHGGSEQNVGYSFDHHLHDVHQILTQLSNGTPAVIVGQSLGGQIASRFAAVFAERVSRLVLLEGLGPPAERSDEDPDGLARYRARLLEQFATRNPSRGMADLEEAAAKLRTNNPRMGDALARVVAENVTRRSNDGRLRWNFDHNAIQVFNGCSDEGPHYWRNVRCPALVISGELSHEYWGGRSDRPEYDGRYAAGEMDERAAIMPLGRHVPFQHSGHMVHFDEPERVVVEIENFLKEAHHHD